MHWELEKKNGSCPNKCENSIFKPVIEKNRVITKFKFKCIKGCGTEIPFNDIKNHYSSNCLINKKNTNNKKANITILTKDQALQYQKTGNALDYMTSKIKLFNFIVITLGDTGVGKKCLINT